MTDTVLVVTQTQQLVVGGQPAPTVLTQTVTTGTTLVTQAPAPQQVLTQQVQGPAGAPGVQGPPGTDKTFAFTQSTPASTWTITHNLGKYPSVSVVDSAGDEVEGDVVHVSPNQLTVTFAAAFSGSAYLN